MKGLTQNTILALTQIGYLDSQPGHFVYQRSGDTLCLMPDAPHRECEGFAERTVGTASYGEEITRAWKRTRSRWGEYGPKKARFTEVK